MQKYIHFESVFYIMCLRPLNVSHSNDFTKVCGFYKENDASFETASCSNEIFKWKSLAAMRPATSTIEDCVRQRRSF